MTDLTIFAYESTAVRTVILGDEPWFAASDIARILGYRNAPDMTRNLDEDEKGTQIVRTLGGEQELSVVSESGLYAAIFKSRRAEARKFRKWVTAEVLPAIRKTGHYAAASPALTFQPMDHGADVLVSADRTFRAMLRTCRAAGLRLPVALGRANEVTRRRTGVDILAEIAFTPPDPGPTSEDDLDDQLDEWLESAAPGFAVADIVAALYDVGPEDADYRPLATRIGMLLARRGYRRRRLFVDGRPYVYERPH